jgi:hypothetical protein
MSREIDSTEINYSETNRQKHEAGDQIDWTNISQQEVIEEDQGNSTDEFQDHATSIKLQNDDPCRQARRLFLSGSAGKLIKYTTEDFQSQLDRLFMRAKHLSLDIWTRRSTIVCSFIQALKDEVYVDKSKKLVPHPLFLPEDLSELYGKQFSILVHPLIEVFGNEEGQEYSEGRVLTSAVVWFAPV